MWIWCTAVCGRKVRESAARCSKGLLDSITLPPAEYAEAAWKVSSWGTCGINLDLQPLPPWVSPPCFPSRCFARGRPWLVISRNRALCLNTLDWSGSQRDQGVWSKLRLPVFTRLEQCPYLGLRGRQTDGLCDYKGRSSASLSLCEVSCVRSQWKWTDSACCSELVQYMWFSLMFKY